MASPATTPRTKGGRKLIPISESGLFHEEDQDDLDSYFQQMRTSSDEPSSPSSLSTSSSSSIDHFVRGFPMQLHVPEAFAAHQKQQQQQQQQQYQQHQQQHQQQQQQHQQQNQTQKFNTTGGNSYHHPHQSHPHQHNHQYQQHVNGYHSQQPQQQQPQPRQQQQKQFYVNENVNNSSMNSKRREEEEKRTFVGRRGLSTGDGEDITSGKGTVRGVKNRVRAGIANFEFQPLDNNKKQSVVNSQDEVGRIIVYTTSVRIVRQTFEDCQYVRKLFQNHRVRFEERDLFMNSKHQKELEQRLGTTTDINLPIIFIDGELVGDLQKLEELNESGELRRILNRFEKHNPMVNCSACGGHRYIPCKVCSGSKKSLLRNNWTDTFHALKCSHCDENGLQRCMDCNYK